MVSQRRVSVFSSVTKFNNESMSASYLVIGTTFESPRFVYTSGLVPPMPPLQTNCNLYCNRNIIHLFGAFFKKELKYKWPCYFRGLSLAA